MPVLPFADPARRRRCATSSQLRGLTAGARLVPANEDDRGRAAYPWTGERPAVDHPSRGGRSPHRAGSATAPRSPKSDQLGSGAAATHSAECRPMAVRRFTALNPVGKGYRAGYSARTDGRVTASHRGTPSRRSGRAARWLTWLSVTGVGLSSRAVRRSQRDGSARDAAIPGRATPLQTTPGPYGRPARGSHRVATTSRPARSGYLAAARVPRRRASSLSRLTTDRDLNTSGNRRYGCRRGRGRTGQRPRWDA